MLLLAQPLCIAAGCSPKKMSHTRTTTQKEIEREKKSYAKTQSRKTNINNERVST